jgi:Protein of unknown function (DUF1569)
MTAPQMLAHLTDAARMALGEVVVARKNLPLARTALFKWMFFNVISFPKNAPSAREITSRIPENWDAEMAMLKALTERIGAPAASETFAAHPIFGTLTAREWGVLAHKHMDHHLRQFGV